jgi:hypothetical protein
MPRKAKPNPTVAEVQRLWRSDPREGIHLEIPRLRRRRRIAATGV